MNLWTYITQQLATMDTATIIVGIIILGLAGSATLLASAALGDVYEGTAKKRSKKIQAHQRGRNRRAP